MGGQPQDPQPDDLIGMNRLEFGHAHLFNPPGGAVFPLFLNDFTQENLVEINTILGAQLARTATASGTDADHDGAVNIAVWGGILGRPGLTRYYP